MATIYTSPMAPIWRILAKMLEMEGALGLILFDFQPSSSSTLGEPAITIRVPCSTDTWLGQMVIRQVTVFMVTL